MLKLWSFIFPSVLILLLCIVPVFAEELVNPASDIIPPEITVISPLADSVIETATPWLEVIIADTGSGIQRSTVHLYLDNIEVTGQALIEETDVTGQAAFQPLRIRYLPRQPLGRGTHKVVVSVQDKAQNLAESRWAFQIKTGIARGMQAQGTNTLQIEQYPNTKVTDNLDFNLQGWVEETRFRLNLQGHAADYPGTIPDYTYEGYRFYRDSYTLGVDYRAAEVIWGNTVAPLESELLQISSGLEGTVFNYQLNHITGQYQGSLFSGDVGSSSGFRGSSDSFSGFIGQWNSNSGIQLKGFYIERGDQNGYRYVGFRGNTVIEKLLFRFETVNGSGGIDDISGNALALHFDRPFGRNQLGLDYTFLDSDYPASGTPSSLSFDNEETKRYVLRSNTRIGTKQLLNLVWALTEEEPDDSVISDCRQNYYLDYQFLATSERKWTLNYQEDFKYYRGNVNSSPEERTQSMIFGFEQQFDNAAKLNTSFGFNQTEDPDPSHAFESIRFFLAWTYPFQKYNLTPSAYFWKKEQDNGAKFSTNEIRLTADFSIYQELSRSKVAVFYRISDETDKESSAQNITGFETAIYLKTTENSSLSVTYNHSLWEEELDSLRGKNRVFRLDWKVNF